MSTFALFGIENSAANTALSVTLLCMVVLWVALVFWTFADARRRIDDPLLVVCATVASIFPFVGTLVYVIVRPPEYLDEVYLRNLEIQAAEERLRQLEGQSGRGDSRARQLEIELERERARRLELERAMSATKRGRRSSATASNKQATTEIPVSERPSRRR